MTFKVNQEIYSHSFEVLTAWRGMTFLLEFYHLKPEVSGIKKSQLEVGLAAVIAAKVLI